jgi:hypothetical protein
MPHLNVKYPLHGANRDFESIYQRRTTEMWFKPRPDPLDKYPAWKKLRDSIEEEHKAEKRLVRSGWKRILGGLSCCSILSALLQKSFPGSNDNTASLATGLVCLSAFLLAVMAPDPGEEEITYRKGDGWNCFVTIMLWGLPIFGIASYFLGAVILIAGKFLGLF